MTYNPDDLHELQRYIILKTGLDPNSVGVVGDVSHLSSGGYHVGNDTLSNIGKLSTDYSKKESSRDRPGTNAASAIDLGSDFQRWMEFNNAFLNSLRNGDSRLADVREFIYTLDGKTVHRWDRLGIRSSGDSSHLVHSHISLFRDAEGRRAGSDNLMGWFKGFFEGENDMAQLTGPDPFDGSSQAAELRNAYYALMAGYQDSNAKPTGIVARLDRMEKAIANLTAPQPVNITDAQMATILDAVKATVAQTMQPIVDALDAAGESLTHIKS